MITLTECRLPTSTFYKSILFCSYFQSANDLWSRCYVIRRGFLNDKKRYRDRSSPPKMHMAKKHFTRLPRTCPHLSPIRSPCLASQNSFPTSLSLPPSSLILLPWLGLRQHYQSLTGNEPLARRKMNRAQTVRPVDKQDDSKQKKVYTISRLCII